MWRKLPDFQAEKRAQNPVTSVAVMVFSVPNIVNSVHTRCIVKTGGFTRGVCKNRGFY